MVHDISLLKMPPTKEAQFLAKGITTLEELVQFFPRKYYDFRAITPISKLVSGAWQCVKGTIIRKTPGKPNKIIIEDNNKNHLSISFFGTYPFSHIEKDSTWFFAGKISDYCGYPYMVNPPYASKRPWEVNRIIPVYPKIKGMSQEYLEKKISEAMAITHAASGTTEKDLLARKLSLMEWPAAIKAMHDPESPSQASQAAKRISFDEIYDFYEKLQRRKLYRPAAISIKGISREKTDDFVNHIPFSLTTGQQNTVEAIIKQISAGGRVDSIVSGDVGCGKTLVAIILSVFMAENNLQTAVLAPTLVLAKQHYEEFSRQLAPLGINVALLTGESKKKEREVIKEGITNGTIHVLIGTHAILSSELNFHQLGMAIIDEEHKFGVAQKQALEQFDRAGAHHVSMTATPIPRSMATAIFGDETTVLPIKTMPAGRKPVITTIESSLEAICEKLKREIAAGHQAYVICPYIEDSGDEAIWSVETTTVALRKALTAYGIAVDSISGNMSSKQISAVMDEFSSGKLDILVSTTIVEVGVNVPNATIVAVLSANRFGLSGLHQLRGRVGRGGDQGFCCLLTDKPSSKLDILCRTNDGFVIAEEDMALRGPGDIMGEAQTGDNHTLQLILKLPKMSAKIKEYIAKNCC